VATNFTAHCELIKEVDDCIRIIFLSAIVCMAKHKKCCFITEVAQVMINTFTV